jgi:hypothetical protein
VSTRPHRGGPPFALGASLNARTRPTVSDDIRSSGEELSNGRSTAINNHARAKVHMSVEIVRRPKAAARGVELEAARPRLAAVCLRFVVRAPFLLGCLSDCVSGGAIRFGAADVCRRRGRASPTEGDRARRGERRTTERGKQQPSTSTYTHRINTTCVGITWMCSTHYV